MAHEASVSAGLTVCSQEQPWGAGMFSWDRGWVPESSRAELPLGTVRGASSCRERHDNAVNPCLHWWDSL